MVQNEAGYLKGVLTRSGTHGGKTDREKLENTKPDTVPYPSAKQ